MKLTILRDYAAENQMSAGTRQKKNNVAVKLTGCWPLESSRRNNHVYLTENGNGQMFYCI
jgi:hypothetical protein